MPRNDYHPFVTVWGLIPIRQVLYKYPVLIGSSCKLGTWRHRRVVIVGDITATALVGQEFGAPSIRHTHCDAA